MKRWFAGEWVPFEKLLSCGEGSDGNTIDDVIDTSNTSVITLITDGTMDGLFPEVLENTDAEKDLLKWMKTKNRGDKWTVWTVADDETMKLIKQFHMEVGVITALVKNERKWQGEWEMCLMAKQALRRMREEVG